MITYPEADYVQNLSAEMLERTKGLPLYLGGPAVDYTHAAHAYALNATLLHDPQRTPNEVLSDGPSSAAQIMLVERASGHGVIGSFSGVSGYIDTFKHDESVASFDPIAHTLREEFTTECGFTDQTLSAVDFYAGKITVEARTITPGAKISIVPILGLCAEPPEITVNKTELASYRWVDLIAIGQTENLSPGYLNVTLPSALGAVGLNIV